MTILEVLNELNNLLKADDIPIYYKPSIKAIMDNVKLEQNKKTCKGCLYEMNSGFEEECHYCNRCGSDRYVSKEEYFNEDEEDEE